MLIIDDLYGLKKGSIILMTTLQGYWLKYSTHNQPPYERLIENSQIYFFFYKYIRPLHGPVNLTICLIIHYLTSKW